MRVPCPQGVVFNEMRSKTKVLQKPVTSFNPKDLPDWSFDGSSTGQAEGNNSDCILKWAPLHFSRETPSAFSGHPSPPIADFSAGCARSPVAVYPDPVRGGDDGRLQMQLHACA